MRQARMYKLYSLPVPSDWQRVPADMTEQLLFSLGHSEELFKKLRCNAAFAILYCAEAAVPESIVRLYVVVTVTDLVIRPRGR